MAEELTVLKKMTLLLRTSLSDAVPCGVPPSRKKNTHTNTLVGTTTAKSAVPGTEGQCTKKGGKTRSIIGDTLWTCPGHLGRSAERQPGRKTSTAETRLAPRGPSCPCGHSWGKKEQSSRNWKNPQKGRERVQRRQKTEEEQSRKHKTTKPTDRSAPASPGADAR